MDETLTQSGGQVVVVGTSIPANGLDLLVNELVGEVVETLSDFLILSKNGLDSGNGVENLVPHVSVGLLAETLDERQQGSGGTITSSGKSGSGTDGADLVLRRQLIGLSSQLGQARRRVVDAEEAVGVAVELVEVVVNVADGLFLLGQELVRNTSLALLALKSKRNPPGSGVVVRLDITSGQEARLLDRDLSRLFGNSHNGVTNLADPRLHELVDVLAGSLAEGIPQSDGLGVTVSIGLEVLGNSFEESLLAQVVGQHADSRASLEIANVVEDLVDVKSVPDGDVNGVTGTDAVESEGSLHTLVDKLRPHLPVRVHVVNSIPTGPGSETLVQPELIPPVHGDQVAEPLVSKFVRDNVGNVVLEARRSSGFIVEDTSGSVSDETPVLHGSVCEFVNSEQVGLGERVLNLENVGEEVNDLGGVFNSPFSLVLETASSVNADGQLLAVVLALSETLNVLEITESPGQEVGAHDGSALKGHDLPALLAGLGVLDRHVAEDDLVDGDLNVKVEGSLQVGLVKARESSTSIGRLELCAEHVVELVVEGDGGSRVNLGLVLAAVETSHVVVDDAVKLNDYVGLLGDGDLLVELDGGALGLFIVADTAGSEGLLRLCVVDGDLCLANLDLEGVEDDLGGGLDDFALDSTRCQLFQTLIESCRVDALT